MIDLGHTRIKWAHARDGEILADTTGACGLDEASSFDRFIASGAAGRVWICASAGNAGLEPLHDCIDRHGLSSTRIETGSIDLPVEPAYTTLGCDRWLALQWAWRETRGACCVVDCGTAVTVDLIDRGGRHLGGWIMAGLEALRAGLLTRARGLPQPIAVVPDPAQPRCESAQAVAAGTLLQLIGAIDRAVKAGSRRIGVAPSVWLTGGDAAEVGDHLEVHSRQDPWLVLRGLALAARRA